MSTAPLTSPHTGTMPHTHSERPVRLPRSLDRATDSPTPARRLLAVELRKSLDTRSGRWLLIAIAALTAISVVVMLFTGEPSEGKDLYDFLLATAMPQAILMPIIGILMVTSEWSQRTGLTTFVLEPRRSRVTQAKIGAAVLLGVAMVTFAMAVGAVATLLSQVLRGGDPSWSVSALSLGGIYFGQLVGVLMGLAFGMVLQNSPAAIVAYLGLPTLWSILGQVSWITTAANWLDTNRTLIPLFDGTIHGEQWAQLGASVVAWVILPMALGIWRLSRSEVK